MIAKPPSGRHEPAQHLGVALDLYFAVMTHWRPRRAWFADQAPKVLAAADRSLRAGGRAVRV